MRWYEGSIAEAVSLSRKNGSIFVVYVEGTDDESIRLSSTINKEDVSKELGSNHFVAIKIEANSVPHQQFSEIYKGAKIPSVYFIGKNGAPLDIVEKVNDSAEFLRKIDTVLKKAGISSIRTTVQEQSSNLIAEERKEVVSEDNVNALKTGGTAAGTSKVGKNVTETPESNVSTEEKIEKAQQQIEKNREAKRKEEEEKERLKEIERRKMGQDVQKMKRMQHDQELKQLMESREKEKKEQQAAKQRILEQIKQDKVDRAARFSTNPATTQPSPLASSPPVQRVLPTGIARIQFKLPDGRVHTHEFKSENTLLDIKIYIKSNLNLSYNFVLATTFPKREFTNENDTNTLEELELVPSAVLLILPVSHGTVSTNSRTFTSFLWSLLAPILNVLNYLKSRMFGVPKPAEQPTSTQDSNKRPAEPTPESSRPYPKKRAGETTVVKRQGNVHRLSDKADSDDDNNTWNGNSTQQM